MSLVFEKYNSENLFTAGKSIASARVKMQEIVYLWDFSSQRGNATLLMVCFPSFFSNNKNAYFWRPDIHQDKSNGIF